MAILDCIKAGNWNAVTNADELHGLDDVLGFFDELGYYWQNNEISSDVLYEHFYDDLRTYCQAGRGHIQDEQKSDSSADYEYVLPLFEHLTKMEAEHTGKALAACEWKTNELIDNLLWEIREAKAK